MEDLASGGTRAAVSVRCALSIACSTLGLFAACYSPHPQQGAPCVDDSRCPAGQLCTAGFCRSEAELDAAVAADAFRADSLAAADAAALDAGVDELSPWGTPVRVNLAGIPAGDLDDPTLTADLLELYFNLNRDIYVTTRASTIHPWAAPMPVSAINSPFAETTPEISGDGLTLYFASDRGGTTGLVDIWVSSRASRSAPWTAPSNVSALNTPFTDTGGTLSQDGLSILINTVSPNGNDTSDIRMSARAALVAPWVAPLALPSINEPGVDDQSAMLTQDGRAVYFESARGGSPDLYVARRPAVGVPFAAPTPIAELNTASADEDPWISTDGRHLFFASKRSGKGELYEAVR